MIQYSSVNTGALSAPSPVTEEPDLKTPEEIAAGAMNRLCAYDGRDAPGDYMSTMHRVRAFMARFVELAANRLATTVSENPDSLAQVRVEEPEEIAAGAVEALRNRVDALESEVRDARTNASGMSGYFTLGGRLNSMQERICALESAAPAGEERQDGCLMTRKRPGSTGMVPR